LDDDDDINFTRIDLLKSTEDTKREREIEREERMISKNVCGERYSERCLCYYTGVKEFERLKLMRRGIKETTC